MAAAESALLTSEVGMKPVNDQQHLHV